jgi:hypothetical protein
MKSFRSGSVPGSAHANLTASANASRTDSRIRGDKIYSESLSDDRHEDFRTKKTTSYIVDSTRVSKKRGYESYCALLSA